MPTPIEVNQIALRHGRNKKRINVIAAVLCGGVPSVFMIVRFSSSWKLVLPGVIVGFIWGNAFEYLYHRWLLHRPRSPLGVGHHRHHAHIGTPEDAEHVALISSPLNVFLLFVINGIPGFLITSAMGWWGILSGILLGWSVYLILTEEIHWRIHIGGWLPFVFQFARAYHMSHHTIPNTRY